MKTAIKGLLATVRLAPANQIEHLADQVRRKGLRTSKLEKQIAKLRTDIDTWKSLHQTSEKAAAEWKRATSKAQARSAAHTIRAEAAAEEWKERALALKERLHSVRTRLHQANQTSKLAQEHLMATEVKLDLVEAAIHVLDARTRKSASQS
jgi:chromosome segregation ATPase